MHKALPELLEEFCSLSNGKFPEKKILAGKLALNLRKISEAILTINSRFVDIDPTTKVSNLIEFEKFKIEMAQFRTNSEKLENDLLAIYELFSTYLSIQTKYGEAADWYLKQEFDDHMGDTIESTIDVLDSVFTLKV
jgi:hypothetical protein